VLLVAGLMGCGDDDASEGGRSAPTADPAAFPVTITDKLGTAEIPSAPRRVVALGYSDIDVALALGVTPVGIERQALDRMGILPWDAPLIGSARVELIDTRAGVPFERVAALRPDLILATGLYTVADAYSKLAAIPPTVGYQVGPAEDSWQQQTRLIGRALGRGADAEALVTRTERAIATARAEHPELQGKTFTLTRMFANNFGVLRSEADSGVKLLSQLGLVLAPAVRRLEGDEYAVTLSYERLDVLDRARVVGVDFESAALRRRVEGMRLFKALRIVRERSWFAFARPTFWATRQPSVLSIPYALEHLVPQLSAAAR
jgi:iron complex transport system substrate-binding protein